MQLDEPGGRSSAADRVAQLCDVIVSGRLLPELRTAVVRLVLVRAQRDRRVEVLLGADGVAEVAAHRSPVEVELRIELVEFDGGGVVLQRARVVTHPVQQCADLAMEHGVGQGSAPQLAGGSCRARHVAGFEQATRAVQPEPVGRLELQRAIDRPQRVGQALHLAQQPAREVPPVRIVRVVAIEVLARLQRLPQVTGFDAAGDPIRHLLPGARRSRCHAPSERIA